MMISLIENYKQKQIYDNLENLMIRFKTLEYFIDKDLKEVDKVLKKFRVDYRIFAVPWFITLFASIFPFELSLRFIDLYLYKSKFIYQMSLAVLKIKEN